MDEGLIMAFVAFALGGVLKGAIGAGTPVIAVPIMSLYYGVPFAVSVFAIPAFLSNIWQLWQFRADLMPRRFVLPLTFGAGVGAALGTVMLAGLSGRVLMMVVAGLALIYVAFRIRRPGWSLQHGMATKIAAPVGVGCGILQGAAGISAPLSISFISALGLSRPGFIATISALFMAMSIVQIPSLWAVGLLTPERAGISLMACLPLFAGMPLGEWLARFISRDSFDKIVMALLTLIALRLFWEAI